jgi:hypothetical protein
MKGDSGVEGRRDCAGERSRRRRELSSARKYREGLAEEARKGVLFGVKAQRDRARREARGIRVRESRFMRQKCAVVESVVGFL